jgi:hypothetical protein
MERERVGLTAERLAEWTRSDEVLAMHEAGITNYSIGRKFKTTASQIATLIEQGRRRRARRATISPVERKAAGMDDPGWCLPCDVRLVPSTTIPKGCSLKTLLTALHAIDATRGGQ